jgi:hypothetical protein
MLSVLLQICVSQTMTYLYFDKCIVSYSSFIAVQWNLWIATLWNEDILWNKDTSSGPKLLFSVQIALWNEDTSE